MIIQRKGFKVMTPADEGIEFFDRDSSEWELSLKDYTIFLAGPCPRDDYNRDWRYEAFDLLEKYGFEGLVFSPTNCTFVKNDIEYLKKQVTWETTAMNCADLVVFWIPRTEKDLGLTTNIEIGTFLNESNFLLYEVGMPDNAIKNDYLKIRLNKQGKPWYTSLEDLMKKVVKRSKNEW